MLITRIVIASGLLLIACSSEQNAAKENPSALFASSASADSLLDLGDQVYRRSEYDSATVLYLKGRAQAVKDGDSAAVTRADTWIGLALWHLGSYDEARRTGEAALAMKQRLGLKAELFRSFNALGLLAHHQGRYADAVALFESAKSSAQAVDDSFNVAKAMGNLALVHSDLGQFDLARRELTHFANVSRDASDTLAFANQLSNLGMLESRSGDPEAAISWLNKAKPLYDAIGYPAGQESVYGQMGSAYESIGEQQKAIAYMDSAIRVARTHGMLREEAEDLQIYGELMGEAGDHTAAIRHLARARRLADSADLQSRKGDIARAQSREEALVSRNDLALSFANEALEFHRRAGNEFEQLADYLGIAEIAQKEKHPDEARKAVAQAGALAVKLNVPIASENLSLGTARVADIAGDPAAVLSALPANLEFVRLGPVAAGEAQALRARAFGKLGQWPEAVAAGKKAVSALDMIRQSLGEGPLRSAFTSDNAAIYTDLIVALLQLGRTSEAFEVADAARGRSLLEHLSSLRQSVRTSARDAAEADRLLRRIDALTQQLRTADTTRAPERTVALRKDQQRLVASLNAARNEYEDRIRRVARTDPRGSVLLGTSRMGAAEVRRALEPNEILIEYFAMPTRLLTFVLSRDTVVSLSHNVSVDDLGNKVSLASQLVTRPGAATAASNVLRGLHDLLIDPIAQLPQYRQASAIIVVPHSALTYLPFAALASRDGKRLVESKSILVLPSASSVPLLRASAPDSRDAKSSVFAPFPAELRGTMEEATAVKAETKKARTYLAANATELQLRKALSSGDNVHVASHAVLNQTNPMFSKIELHRGNSGSPEDDGSLDVHEILSIPVRSDLVYLSGCETGAGAAWSTAFRTSQDYATLSQAILYAGAQNVVATLWRIDDAGASVFATRFYAALAHSSPADALAIAQRQMIGDRRYSAPKYWAAYVVSGSGLPRSSQSQQRASVP